MKKTVKILAIAFTIILTLSLTGCKLTSTVDKASQIIDSALEQQSSIIEHGLQQQEELLEFGKQQQEELLGNISGKDKTPDYEAIIDSFVPDTLNTETLTVGKTHSPNGSIWLQGGKGFVYTSDESVVTVTELGKVTAVGEGTAYVVVAASSSMYRCYRYDVTAE